MGRGRLSISQRERGRMGGVAGRGRLSLSQGEVGRTGGIHSEPTNYGKQLTLNKSFFRVAKFTTQPLLRRWPLSAEGLVYAVNLSFQFGCFTQVYSARDERQKKGREVSWFRQVELGVLHLLSPLLEV